MIGEVSNHLWQSTVFAIMAGLLTLAFRRNRAQVRYWLWFSASVKFLIPFSILLTLGSHLGRSRPASSVAVAPITYTVVQIAEPFAPSPAPAPMTQSRGDWIPIAVVSLWACGFAGIGLMRLRGWLRIRAAVRAGTPLDIPFPVEVRSSPALLEPGVVGFFRPILLCPRSIVERLTPSQLQAVLGHERCHIERRDNLTAVVHMIVEAVFWFHPLVWWISARLIEERERACDEEVLELGSERQVYAESILKTCEFCVESPLACVSGVTGADLKKRIVRIMTERLANDLSFGRKILLAGVGIAVVAGPVVFGLMSAPQIRAQSPVTASGAKSLTGSEAENPGAKTPAFDVVSIKPHKVGGNSGGWRWLPDGLSIKDTTLKVLIGSAYGMFDDQISGAPGWTSDRFDVEAKMDDEAAAAFQKLPKEQQATQRGLMLQSLLADRCKLKIHYETKEHPTYALVIAKGGFKLKEADPNNTYANGIKVPEGRPRAGLMMVQDGKITGQAITTSRLAAQLGGWLRSPVVDKTGLTGKYDFTLQWSPDEGGGMTMQGAGRPTPSDDSGPSIFTALQEQLGLKLESTKGPVEIIVIDHIERPSEN